MAALRGLSDSLRAELDHFLVTRQPASLPGELRAAHDFGRDRVAGLGAPRRDDDVRAVGRARQGNAFAHAPSGAGDEHSAAFE